jgi:hypothetical protein
LQFWSFNWLMCMITILFHNIVIRIKVCYATGCYKSRRHDRNSYNFLRILNSEYYVSHWLLLFTLWHHTCMSLYTKHSSVKLKYITYYVICIKCAICTQCTQTFTLWNLKLYPNLQIQFCHPPLSWIQNKLSTVDQYFVTNTEYCE